ncbi:MAG TPA: bifunctional DNA primase/polymerase [Anaeromyxobacter sp.]|nr:bifunctional DNA primase/polymerase [Anaeromyxobacter sp.]
MADLLKDTLSISALMLAQKGFQVRATRVDDPARLKSPVLPGWQHPRTPEQVRADFELAPEGAMIGVVTGNGLICIDIDCKGGIDGRATLSELELREGLSELPDTVRDRTPTGGEHRFYKVPTTVRIPNSSNRLGPGLDVRGENGFVVVPPSQRRDLPEGENVYEWLPGCSPLEPEEREIAWLPGDWLAYLLKLAAEKPAPKAEQASAQQGEKLYAPGDREFALRRAQAYLAQVEGAVSGQNGHGATFRAACRAAELCIDPNDVLVALQGWNQTSCQPPWSEADLRHKVRDALKAVQLGSKFDAPPPAPAPEVAAAGTPSEPPAPREIDPRVRDRLVWVEETQRYYVRRLDTGSWGKSMFHDAVHKVLRDRGIPKDDATRILNDHALQHAQCIDLLPNEPPIVQRQGEEGPYLVVNNWVRPSIVPAPGEFPILDECITFVSGGPEEKRYLMHWLACCLQMPSERFRTSPLLWGKSKTGKSLLTSVLRALLGEENTRMARSCDLVSRFNAYAAGLLVVVNEIKTEHLHESVESIKQLTGERRLPIEEKGEPTREVWSKVKLIGSSNADNPVIVEPGDTRWSLLRQEAEASPEYLARLDSLFVPGSAAWSERGKAEIAALGWHLLHMEADRSVTSNPLKNAARDAAIAMSQSSVHAFADAVDEQTFDGLWLSCVEYPGDPAWKWLDVPDHPDLTGKQAVYQLYVIVTKRNQGQPCKPSRFHEALRRARPEWQYLAQEGGHDQRVKVEGAGNLACWKGLPRNPELRGVKPKPKLPVPFAEPEPPPATPEQARLALKGTAAAGAVDVLVKPSMDGTGVSA